jgi:hypothetical protein
VAVKSYVNLTASGVVLPSRGRLAGFYVNSTTSGTIVFWDNTAASGTQISGTITPAAGLFHPFPVDVLNGLYAQIGGTLNVTFLTE